jgi:hypothetical protein
VLTLCTYVCICVGCLGRWIRRLLLVVTGARCPRTKLVVTAVEQQAATEPNCSRGVQPGGICVCVVGVVVQREPTGRACAQAAGAPYTSAALVLCV